MKNPYFIDEPCVISCSGGESSMYMLIEILEAHSGTLPDWLKVFFANTGREMPETLDFVHRCERELSINIHWLELSGMENIGTVEKPEYRKEYKRVDYETASRDGEPFDLLLDAMPAIPNVVNMACTAYLKTRIMRMHAYTLEMDQHCLTAIGMRADEVKRVGNAHDKKIEGFEGYCPLYLAGATKKTVKEFWQQMPWSLELPKNPDGSTTWGNCDICYKKSLSGRASIIREHPDLADWWIRAEEKKGQQFRPDQPSYRQMLENSERQYSMLDDSMPCFCGD